MTMPKNTETLKEYADRTGQSFFLIEWDDKKNAPLTPETVYFGSNKKVWWRCEKGHEWEASIKSRAAGRGCPYCANKKVLAGYNDLLTLRPDIAVDWHPTLNGDLLPTMVTEHSGQSVWWCCELGHAYQARINSRTGKGSGCPYCTGRKVLAGFNDLATVHPDLARQWHPTLNGDLKPTDVTSGMANNVWWICAEGHVWQARIFSRAGKNKTGCPVCAGKTKRR